MLPAFGFDYVPGDLAARLAAEKVEGPLDELVVAYSVKGVGNEQGDTAHDQARDGSEAGGVAGRPARPVGLRRDDAHGSLPVRRADGGRVGRHRAAHGAAAHGRPGRAVVLPRARRSPRRPAAWPLRGAVRPRRFAARPARAFGGVPAEEPLHGRRRGARPRGNRSRGCRRHRSLRADGASDRPSAPRRFSPARRAARACSLRPRRSTPARSPAGSSRTCGSWSDVVRSGAYGAGQCNGSER